MGKLSTPEHFWSRVSKNGPVPEGRPDLGPCWLWNGALDTHGYGCLGYQNRRWLAHRLARVLCGRELPKAPFEPDHLCRVRNCVNPDHQEIVTNRVNNLRGTGAAARHARKTHCKNGHALSGTNLYRYPNRNKRGCRTCTRSSHARNIS